MAISVSHDFLCFNFNLVINLTQQDNYITWKLCHVTSCVYAWAAITRLGERLCYINSWRQRLHIKGKQKYKQGIIVRLENVGKPENTVTLCCVYTTHFASLSGYRSVYKNVQKPQKMQPYYIVTYYTIHFCKNTNSWFCALDYGHLKEKFSCFQV